MARLDRARIYAILEGDNKEAYVYGKAMTVIILLSLLPLCFKYHYYAFDVLEWICTAIFVVDYIARWSTADFKLGRGMKSFAMYPFTPMAIIDLLSILPSFMLLNEAWRVTRVFRLLRVLRAFRLVRYSKSMSIVGAVFRNHKRSLLAVGTLALMYIFLSALVVFNVEPNTFDTFFDAVYWSVVSLTTVGYGDLYPSTNVGRLVAMVSSFMGIAVVALPSGIITAGLLSELEKNREDGEEDEG